jgi:hypothetical protein
MTKTAYRNSTASANEKIREASPLTELLDFASLVVFLLAICMAVRS